MTPLIMEVSYFGYLKEYDGQPSLTSSGPNTPSITVLVADVGKWCHKIRGDIVSDVLCCLPITRMQEVGV